jgi:hypothetical protein
MSWGILFPPAKITGKANQRGQFMKDVVSPESVHQKIFLIRGQKVMLSPHLAELYGVEVRSLVQAVKRNRVRFPSDFMFLLTDQEVANLKSQFVISSWGGVRRSNPYAFTEQGVAMLSSVLNSQRAIRVNIQIIRAFVHLRQMIGLHKEVAEQLARLEARVDRQDEHIAAIFEAIKQLMAPPAEPPPKPKMKIGFDARV